MECPSATLRKRPAFPSPQFTASKKLSQRRRRRPAVRNELLVLARSLLEKNEPEKRDSPWDSQGTPLEVVSQRTDCLGTSKITVHECKSPPVQMSRAIGDGTAGHSEDSGTAPGTPAGQPLYSASLTALKSKCPEAIEFGRWQQAI